MKARSKCKSFALVIAAVALIGSSASTFAATPAPRLSALERLIAAAGINPAKAVIQKGVLNYAGPNCPGAGWTCVTTTSDRPVVQIAQGRSGANRFDCTPSSSAGPNACTVAQSSSGGTNTAVCRESTTAAGVTQTCQIDQSNTTGPNNATVEQTITQTTGSSQAGAQSASVSQTNGSGANSLTATQTVSQDSNLGTTGPQSQAQESHQTLTIAQDTTAGGGSNATNARQSLTQNAYSASATSLVQQQNSADAGPNSQASIDQRSSSGRNDATLTQTTAQEADATNKLGTVSQQQNTSNGGEKGTVNQSSTGESHWTVYETETQKVEADTASAKTQTQFGPIVCCSSQGTNPADTCDLTQRSTQRASTGTGGMSELVHGRCTTSGNGTVSQTVVENGTTTSNSCTGQSCDKTIGCASGGCTTTAPAANVSPSSLSFGTKYVGGTTGPQTVTVTNTGDATLHPSSATVAGPNAADFAKSSDTCTGASVAPAASCTVGVTFSPSAAGARTATLTIADDTFEASHAVALSGTGVADGTAPTTTFTTANNSVLVRSSGAKLTGQSTDDLSGVTSVAIQYREPSNPAIIEFTATATLACTDASHLICPWSAELPIPGTYLVTAQATDASGNVESPGPAPITIFVA